MYVHLKWNLHGQLRRSALDDDAPARRFLDASVAKSFLKGVSAVQLYR